MQRQQALQLLHQYTQTTSLRGHAYCVEAAMRAYARLWQENEEVYGICGLLHDFDYERWPQEHPQRGQSILREAGLSDAICEAIMGHADHTGWRAPAAWQKRSLPWTNYAVLSLLWLWLSRINPSLPCRSKA
jgi:predicted hydrolase (HD superfamily)